jgi:hypothetical protein
MAGNRQHILPRFLLKGFASRVEGEKIFTWLYPRNHPPIEADIRKVSVGRHFYGRQGELNVDGEVTDFEGEYAPFLSELRMCKESVEISDQRIANIVTHLVVRTKHVRDSFRESTEYLAELICQYFSDFNNLKRAMLGNPEMIRDNIEKGFRDHQQLLPYKNFLMPLLPKIILDHINDNKDELHKLCQDYFDLIKKVAPKAMKEGHIKGLIQSLTPELRVEDFKSLRWFIYNSNELLILGDIGCLIEVEGDKRFKSMDVGDDVIKNVFLPISDRQLLIGTSLSTITKVNINILNETIAKCSREFFISSKNCPTKQSLVYLLGSETEIYSKEEVQQIAKNIFYKYSVNHN